MSASASAPKVFTLQKPETFLRYLQSAQEELSLAGVTLTEMWSLTALGALARRQRAQPLRIVDWQRNTREFARAVGYDELVEGRFGPVEGVPGRTVRLSSVWTEGEVEPVSRAVAAMLAEEDPKRTSSRYALQYMVAELLRNVIQHSGEDLGAVCGAQRNDRGQHGDRPVYQVAIADNGRGIRASLQDRHQDIETDEVALERALWPHFSRAFSYGRTGGEKNAGLGLFYVSELVKELGGRMLMASGAASLMIDSTEKRLQRFLTVGYPGALVAFEIPVESPRDFGPLFEEIGRRADERTPRRLVHERLRYDSAPAKAKRFLVSRFLENTDKARTLASKEIIPRLVKRESVVLDFINVSLCTQSFAHALLFEALRVSWAMRTPIYVVNVQPVVRSALRHVEMYSQSG